jgi:purine-binding chemotaxis protein CheW
VTATVNRETQIVGFRVGRETYGIPIMALSEIVRVPEITAVPDAPAHLEGVINLRGKIVSVVDLRKRFNQPATALTRHNRILVVEHRGRFVGMIVDAASEVLKIAESEIEPAPAIMKEGGLDCVTGLGKFQKRLIILLDIDKVLTLHEASAAEPKPKQEDPATVGARNKAGAQRASAGK